MISRRRFVTTTLLGTTTFAARLSARSQPAVGSFASQVAAIEKQLGGRIGVTALDTGSGKRLSHRGDERFAMCSTFKWVLASATLAKVDRHEARLDQLLKFSKKDLLPTSPVTEAHLTAGSVDLETLCKAVIETSDNAGANLLIDFNGGPAALTKFVRGLGDTTTRFDRKELDLNTNIAGDPRDTTTPNAMVTTLKAVLVDKALSDAMRGKLIQSFKDCKTGLARLRAGVPKDWTAGDKTGTGSRGAVNDVAIFWPPKRAPILVACYMSDSTASTDEASAAHAAVARTVAVAMGAA